MPNAVSLPLELQDHIAKQSADDRSSLEGMLATSAAQFVFTLPVYLKHYDIDNAGFNIIVNRLRMFTLRQQHYVQQKWLIGISKNVENKAIREKNYFAKALLAYLYALELKIIAQGGLETDAGRKPELQSKLTLLSLDSSIKKHVASAMISLLSPADYQAQSHAELSVFFLELKQAQAPSAQEFQIIFAKFHSATRKAQATEAIKALIHMPGVNNLDPQQLAALLEVVFHQQYVFYENVNFIQEIIAFLKPQILKLDEKSKHLMLERLRQIVAKTKQNCSPLLAEIRYFSSALESNQPLLDSLINTLLSKMDHRDILSHVVYFIAQSLNYSQFIQKLLLNLQKGKGYLNYLVINSMVCLSDLLQIVPFSDADRATLLTGIVENLKGYVEEVVSASILQLPRLIRFFSAAQVIQVVDILLNVYQKSPSDRGSILTALYTCTLTPFVQESQQEIIVGILLEAITADNNAERGHAIGLMDRYLASNPHYKELTTRVTSLLLNQIRSDARHESALIFLQKHTDDSLSYFIELLVEGTHKSALNNQYYQSLSFLIPQLVDPKIIMELMSEFVKPIELSVLYDVFKCNGYATLAKKLVDVIIKNKALLHNVEIQNLFYTSLYPHIDNYFLSLNPVAHMVAREILAIFLPYMAKARGTEVIISPTIDEHMQALENHQQDIFLANLSHLQWLVSASAAHLDDPASLLKRNREHIRFAYNRRWSDVKTRDKVHLRLARIVTALFLYCSEENADVNSFQAELNCDSFLELLNNNEDILRLLDKKSSAYIDQLLQLIDINLARTKNAELKNQALSILISIAFIHPNKRERVVNSIQRVEQPPIAYQQISRLIIAGWDDPKHISKNIISVIALKIIKEAYQEYRAWMDKKSPVMSLFFKQTTVADDVYQKTFLSQKLNDMETLDDRLASTILGLAGNKFAEILIGKITSTIPAGMLANLPQTAAVLRQGERREVLAIRPL